jgi:hypothetical protein
MMLPLDKLMLRFEALGDNCELGLVQRRAGAEPLGLLRFAGFFIPLEIRLARLLKALECRFEGLGRPDTVRVEAAGADGRREYLIKESAFDLMYHSFQAEGSIDPGKLRDMEAKKLEFLRRKFLSDLADADKLLVWKSNAPPPEVDIDRLVEALRRFGPNVLLWVAEADAEHPAGTVETKGTGLLKGYVDRFAPYANATDISYESWFAMCAEADRRAREIAGR